MSPRWNGPLPPPPPPPGVAGWLRRALRLPAILALLGLGLVGLLAVRLSEAPLAGPKRPVSGWVVVWVCRASLTLLGLRRAVAGQLAPGPALIAANHISWLDILVLNAIAPVTFVAKAEVADWAGIGFLARATGTVFIARRRQEAGRQQALLADRLAQGARLVLFAEGTSSDGQRVLPFRPSLFAALDGPRRAVLQPLSLRYTPPKGRAAAFHGWWGEMALMPHLAAVLAAPAGGQARVQLHPTMGEPEAIDRKRLAEVAEATVRAGHQALAA